MTTTNLTSVASSESSAAPIAPSSVGATPVSPLTLDSQLSIEVPRLSQNQVSPAVESISLECKESIDVPFLSPSEREKDSTLSMSQGGSSLLMPARPDPPEGTRLRKGSAASAFVEVGRSPHLAATFT